MIKKAKVPLFDSCTLYMCDDPHEAWEWSRKSGVKVADDSFDFEMGFAGVVFGTPRMDIMMFVSPSEGGDTVAHEAVHVAHQVCEMTGAPGNHEGQEVIAHLTGWAFKQFVDKIIKPRGRMEGCK